MNINFDLARLRTTDVPAWELVRYLHENEQDLSLSGAEVYFDFPVLKDPEDAVVRARLLLVSPNHGVILISPVELTDYADLATELSLADSRLEHVFSLIYSRLIRNRSLRRSKTDLAFPINSLIFAPNLKHRPENLELDAEIATNSQLVEAILNDWSKFVVPPDVFVELTATLEGAKGLIRLKPREVKDSSPTSKGALANKIEAEIASFDRRQKNGYMSVLDGLQRIRGLAGSGKTVVLAMKAALTHLRDPDATIVYTFYTKSLYQHIQRLITRFYRQFDDTDPDWSRLKIMHGWGGQINEGVYYNACVANNISPITFQQARARSHDPFDFACKNLLSSGTLTPIYDYVFVDEGQDFPASFIKLCTQLTRGNRVVFAYDDLQTIFQPTAPEISEIVGRDEDGKPAISLSQDVVLYKCYRNPREILVCAHALGFGIYDHPVQMLENKEQWEDIGYIVHEGTFQPGSSTVIERPSANSLTTISENQKASEIVDAIVFSTFDEEISYIIDGISRDIAGGLRPDDILVAVVDDRNARTYLKAITSRLIELNIQFNNLHDDSYGIRDFHKEGAVTLSTVHKAKGNEAYMVYVAGIDALNSTTAGVRERNVLFTAMTRAKGWVRLSGIGKAAAELKTELLSARNNLPFLKFVYPSQQTLKIIRRDLQEGAIRKQRSERKLDELLEEMSVEEIMKFVEQRSIKKGK